ncbi:N-acetylmuramoyl-L-alanine amidase [Streptomyces purpurogeneiscleroticus]|uniref:N-acetylmuramoyl-L-alanine amidase n=1 Tax=Streptomyces purpurogeneiscleroticus TaxID=68259 RepID=UPI001CBB60E5|nr:N-acetylmuramoyl-L-alanine amidase [Streptomyces purpurogeneiscleroticus]MBZ4017313.1 N-acetylmuramoyl-L-alanine amidase [Streptomyces purpurogeneiscleroticus]
MSNGSTPPTSRRPARTLLVVPAALAALCCAGCGAVGNGNGDGAASPARPGPERPAAAGSHTPDGRPTGQDETDGKHSDGDRSNGGKSDRDKGDEGRGGPLRGKVVLIDPGHNPGNRHHTAEIARKVDVGNARKECDTTGTSTNSGYAEASFTLDVARRARTLLQKEGVKVVFTQDGDRPYGPCVDERAEIGNDAHADAALSIHADGAGAGNRGFHVIRPGVVHSGGADTRKITGPSRDLADHLVGRFVAATGSAPANYIGNGKGLDTRTDLGGLNLSRVPKVFLECGNMRDAQDAARLTDPAWRQKAAVGITEGITGFLRN